MSNYPPGVSGNEPQITGEWPCRNCGATLPEEAPCPECDPRRYPGATIIIEGEDWYCPRCERKWPGDECPGGCVEPDYDSIRERREEDSARDRYGY